MITVFASPEDVENTFYEAIARAWDVTMRVGLSARIGTPTPTSTLPHDVVLGPGARLHLVARGAARSTLDWLSQPALSDRPRPTWFEGGDGPDPTDPALIIVQWQGHALVSSNETQRTSAPNLPLVRRIEVRADSLRIDGTLWPSP